MKNKHAFLIGAYRNPDHLKIFVNAINSDRSNIYIHVNKYNEAEFTEFRKWAQEKHNIYFYSEYYIKWGGHSLVEMHMLLMKEAFKNPENSVFHLLTGEDMLIKPLKSLFKFFDSNDNNFIEYSDLQSDRYKFYDYFQLFEILNYKTNLINKCICKGFMILQQILHVKRPPLNFQELKYGSSWWSLRRNGIDCILNYFKNGQNHKRFKYTFAPDEIYYQSILHNANNVNNLINDNLRYIIWSGQTGPRELLISDYESMKNSNKFFARKFIPGVNDDLLDIVLKDIKI